MTERKRKAFADLLKTIAIIFVVVYHNTQININFIDDQSWLIYVNYYLKSALSVCVPLFFFVNGGLLLNKSSLDIQRHSQKIIKIIILTAVWGAITTFLLSLIRKDPLPLLDIVKSSLYLKFGWNHHLWFFQALIVVYIFYPLLFVTFKQAKKIFYFFGITVFIFTFFNTFLGQIINVVAITLSIDNVVDAWKFNYFSEINAFRGIYGYSIGYFMLGGVLFTYSVKSSIGRNALFTLLLLISMGGLCLYGVMISQYEQKIWDLVWNGYDSLFTLINVVLMFMLAVCYQGSGKILSNTIEVIGKNSLGIYLIHWIIQEPIRSLIATDSFLGTLIATLVIILLSLAITLTIKRTPLLRNLLSL